MRSSLLVLALLGAQTALTWASPARATEDTWETWGIATKKPAGWNRVAPDRLVGTAFYPWIVDLRSSGNQSCTAQVHRGTLYVECDSSVHRVQASRLVRVPGVYGTVVGEIQGGLLSRYCDKYECFGLQYLWQSPRGPKRLEADVALGDSRGVWLFSYEDVPQLELLPLENMKGQAWGNPRLAHPKNYPEHLRQCGVTALSGNAQHWVFDLMCEGSRKLSLWDGKAFAELSVSVELGQTTLEEPWLRFSAQPYRIDLRTLPLTLTSDPSFKPPLETPPNASGEQSKADGTVSVRWRVEGQSRIVEQRVKDGPWTVVPLSPSTAADTVFEAFVHDQELWLLTEEGLFSTKRPERLWVARHPQTMMESDFVPSPLLAAPGCSQPFQILYTSSGTYAQAILRGRTSAGVFPAEGGLVAEADDEPIYQHYADGVWYFGRFVGTIEPKDYKSQTLCIAKNTVARVRL